jgi:DNA-binding MarR family transcriptional regulator
MHRSDDALGHALLELAAFINDPRQDWRMMDEAGLDLDPAFLPLLVRLGARGSAGVVELAAELGRDHSTMSRQLARLESAGLVQRSTSEADARVRTANVTPRGEEAVAAISAARRRLLDRALAEWPLGERETLTRLLGRFAESMKATMRTPPL